MRRILDRWNILGIILLVLCVFFANYFDLIPLYKVLPFLPHEVQPKFTIPKMPKIVIPPEWRKGSQLIKEKKIPAPQKILEINLSYDENASPIIKVASVNIKNGYSPKYLPQDKGYELQVYNKQNKLVASLTFTIPNKLAGLPPPREGEQRPPIDPKDLILKKVDFTLTIPYIETAKTLQILDPNKKVIATKDLSNIPIINNKPNFDSIPGANLPEKQSNLWNFLFHQAFARSSDGKLHIVFISNGYKDINQFHDDVVRFKDTLLTYEPFKTRGSQILFDRVDNTVGLGCNYPDPKAPSLIVCNDSLVKQKINDAVVPHDKIYVIVNDNVIAGTVNTFQQIAVGTNIKDDGQHIFVHELGHILGGLLDEYVDDSYYGEAINTDTVNANCYTGKPTTEVWKGIPISDYKEGCTHKNWWRSSKHSIMQYSNYHYFNTVSQGILNKSIDYYAGQFTGQGSDKLIQLSPTPIPADPCPLTAAPISGPAPLIVTFSVNLDPTKFAQGHNFDGYKWDFDNDGVWDTDVDTNPVATHTYLTPGTYNLHYELRYSLKTAKTDSTIISECNPRYSTTATIVVTESLTPTPTFTPPFQCFGTNPDGVIYSCRDTCDAPFIESTHNNDLGGTTCKSDQVCCTKLPTSNITATPTSIIFSPTPTSTFIASVSQTPTPLPASPTSTPTLTPYSAPISSQPTPTPVPFPTFYSVQPTSTPVPTTAVPTTTPQPKKVIAITINGQAVDINNPLADVHLPGVEGEANKFVVPVIVSYSDGTTKNISLVFDYQPQVTPTPTPTTKQCVQKYGDECGPNLEGSIDCEGRCIIPTPTLTPTPTPKTLFNCSGVQLGFEYKCYLQSCPSPYTYSGYNSSGTTCDAADDQNYDSICCVNYNPSNPTPTPTTSQPQPTQTPTQYLCARNYYRSINGCSGGITSQGPSYCSSTNDSYSCDSTLTGISCEPSTSCK